MCRTRPSKIIKIEQGLNAALGKLERGLGLPVTDFANPVFESDHNTTRTAQGKSAADLVHIPKNAVPPAAMFCDRELASRIARLYAEDFRHYGYPTSSHRSRPAAPPAPECSPCSTASTTAA